MKSSRQSNRPYTGPFTWNLRTRITHKILLLSVYRRAHPVHVHSIHHGDTVGHHIRLWVPRGMGRHHHRSVRSYMLLWVWGWPGRNVEMMSHRKSVPVWNRGLRIWWVAHLWGLSQRDTRGRNGYLVIELREFVWLLGMWVHLRRYWPSIWLRGEGLFRWRLEVHRRCRRRWRDRNRHEFNGSGLGELLAQSVHTALALTLSTHCDILLSPLASAFVGSLFEAGLTRELVDSPVTFWTAIASIGKVVACHTRNH